LKSESAEICIPERDLTLRGRSVGGKFTTVEGLIEDIKDDLSKNTFFFGDSADQQEKEKYQKFIDGLSKLTSLEEPFTIILDDPLSNSYVQDLCIPDPDPNLTVEEYDRSWDQNEELGLNDMKTEGYE